MGSWVTDRRDEPAVYAGQFVNDRLNGHGVWVTTSGAAYSGTFFNNFPKPDVSRKNCSGPISGWSKCVATVRYDNGNVYIGEFVKGHREGIGMLVIHAKGTSDGTRIRAPDPGVYVGEFRDDRPNGRGMTYMPRGSVFGTFTNNTWRPPSS
ncbi:MAG: hypothetical protein ACREP9_03990 [Candidatus Dormibacteraceae bacterium]